MSFVRAQTVAAIADALGAPPLSADAAASLAPHADVRLREVVQDALKAARACKRATLTRQDIDAALAARGEQPLLGWAAARDAARFARAAGHADLFYVDDPEVGFDEIIDKPLPAPPLEVSIVAHWLAVNGIQPATPENSPLPRPRGRAARGVPAPSAAADGDDDDALDGEQLVGPSTARERERRQEKSRRDEAAASAKGKAAAASKAASEAAKAGGEGGGGAKRASDGCDGGEGGGDGGGEAAADAAAASAAEAEALDDAATAAGDLLLSSPAGSPRDGTGGVLVRAPVRHALSEELAAYLEKVASALLPGASGPLPLPPTAFATRGPPAVAAAAAAAAAGGPPGVGSRGAAGQVEAAASASDAFSAAAASARARTRASAAMLSAVLASLSVDPGLHQLAPYLVKLLADGVRSSLDDTAALCRLCRAAGAISLNPGIKLGPYLHRLLPPLMTCLVARKLGKTRRAAGGFGGVGGGARTRGQKRITRAASQAAALAQAAAAAAASNEPGAVNAADADADASNPLSADAAATDAGFVAPDDHWAVRDAAADALARVVATYGRAAENVPARVAKALLATLGDGGMPLASHYGAVVGLAALGTRGVRGVLLPALGAYAAVFEAAAARAAKGAAERAKAAAAAEEELHRDDPEKPSPREAGREAAAAASTPAVADVERVRGAIIRVARGALYGGRGVPPFGARPALLVGARVEGVDNGAGAAAAAAAAASKAKGGGGGGGGKAATTPQASAGGKVATTTTPASSGRKNQKAATTTSNTRAGKAVAAAAAKGGAKRTRAAAAAATKALQTRKSARSTRGSSPAKSGVSGRRSRGATPEEEHGGEEEDEEDDEDEAENESEEEDEEEEETSDGESEEDALAAALRRERREAASAVLFRAWREDAADEQIVRALHELFGDASAPATAVAAGMTLVPL